MRWLLALAIALLPGAAFAYSETYKTIAHVGVQGTHAYITFTTPPIAGCAWDNVYLDITTDTRKAYLSLILTARPSNTPISRIDYSMTSGMCTVDLVEM
jgi:hypothetical protein